MADTQQQQRQQQEQQQEQSPSDEGADAVDVELVEVDAEAGAEMNSEKQATEEKPKALTADQIHHLKVLLHTQSIFGHLTLSLLQSYKPVEFWQEFRYAQFSFSRFFSE